MMTMAPVTASCCVPIPKPTPSSLSPPPPPPRLVTALNTSALQNAASFHFPGHNRGRGAPSSLRRLIGGEALRHDLPELPELEGPLREAQEEAARVFGASRTWFLVGGSTMGIQAAVMATCSPGDALILPRNSHCSAFSAMLFSGAVPHYIVPDYHATWDIAAGVTPSQVESAILELNLKGGKAGAAVLVTSPTYQGICSDIAGIARVCHSHGMALIVDEAHGAHLGFHPSLPPSALQQGADLAVQSTHKVLTSLTQSSMLHLSSPNSNRSPLHPDRVSSSLHALQTTSPSYLLLASLDAATHQLAHNPHAVFDAALQLAAHAHTAIRRLPGISLLDSLTFPQFPTIDPLRLTLGFSDLGLSSYRADQILYDNNEIICELVGTRSITFAFNLGTCREHVDRLVSGHNQLVSSAESTTKSGVGDANHSVVSSPFTDFTTSLIPREAFFAAKRRVGIESCIGEVCGELICPYPPGIPVMIPGETITDRALGYLLDVRNKGAIITGASDPQLSSILVCGN